MAKCQAELPITDFHDSPACPHSLSHGTKFEGKFYCVFHLPDKYKAGLDQNSKINLESQIGKLFRQSVDHMANVAHRKESRRTCDFRGAVFPRGFVVKDHILNSKVIPGGDFQEARFLSEVDFTNVTFDGLSSFNEVIFKGFANFGKAHSVDDGSISFAETEFEKQAYFSGCNLKGVPDFSGTTFSGYADFSQSHFRRAKFADTKFHEGCTFRQANFHESTFLEFSEFGVDELHGSSRPADFFGSIFHGDTSFIGSTFHNEFDLDSAEFKNSVSFSNVIFEHAPSLIGTKFLEDANFENTEFKFGNEATFRKIKKLMEEQRHLWEATLFYARELSEQRKALKGWRKISLNAVFWLMNDYGRKWWLPLVWIVVLLVGFGLIYFLSGSVTLRESPKLVGWETDVSNAHEFWRALLYSAQNLKLSWLIGKPVVLANTWWVWLISGVQTILNLILITMTVLSIRRRFKLL